ncbi:hypothetical protein [Photobacterium sp. TY1-4]|uniref:hypothetical protein n=1 Tax=Photobacterium sp. TY1-4 TaxID=2899122 RepID=UPI0021C0126D|nr:hypothetical protein [Photobacterium sp. TY1-4]UXI03026.1 hypothetical protein NH461_21505 [Photobacterium sp. TY1-4]
MIGRRSSQPWQQPTETPPDIRPFELPALKSAQVIDPDVIFTVVNRCYPEKSKFNINFLNFHLRFDKCDTTPPS